MTRTAQILPAVLAAVMVGGCGGGGGSGSNGSTDGGVLTPRATFTPDRTQPSPGEVFATGEMIDANTLELRFQIDYPSSWHYPVQFRLDIPFDTSRLEPIGLDAGTDWPGYAWTMEPAFGYSPNNNAWVFHIQVNGVSHADICGDYCGQCNVVPPVSWPELPASRVMTLAIMRITVKQSGTFHVEPKYARIDDCRGDHDFLLAWGGVLNVP